jgi:hypothetical protein
LLLSQQRKSPGFFPQEDGRDGQRQREDGYPKVWLKPQYAGVYGLLLGNLSNFLDGWLYFDDPRRPRLGWRWRGYHLAGSWHRRRLGGLLLIVTGVLMGLGGFWLYASSGGGY